MIFKQVNDIDPKIIEEINRPEMRQKKIIARKFMYCMFYFILFIFY